MGFHPAGLQSHRGSTVGWIDVKLQSSLPILSRILDSNQELAAWRVSCVTSVRYYPRWTPFYYGWPRHMGYVGLNNKDQSNEFIRRHLHFNLLIDQTGADAGPDIPGLIIQVPDQV